MPKANRAPIPAWTSAIDRSGETGMNMVQFWFVAALSLPFFCRGGAAELRERQSAELKEINRQVVAQILDLPKYDGKDIYVKAKVLDRGGGKLAVKVEKVTVDQADLTPGQPAARTVYLKGKVSRTSDDAKFKLDLEHVLPPEASKTNPPKTGEGEK